jgi:hypothetical protein
MSQTPVPLNDNTRDLRLGPPDQLRRTVQRLEALTHDQQWVSIDELFQDTLTVADLWRMTGPDVPTQTL